MKEFPEALSDLMNEHGLTCNTCVSLINFDHVLRPDFAEELLTIPADIKDTLRRMAAHYLEHASLSEEQRRYLERIEGGGLPEPFKYGELKVVKPGEGDEHE